MEQQQNKSEPTSCVSCKICGSNHIEVIYSGWLREGLATGAVAGRVYHCEECDTGWLEHRLRKSHNYYKNNTYRDQIPYDNKDELRLLRDRLTPFVGEQFHGKTVTDIGAGNGMFLNVAQALGAETFYLEPNEIQDNLLVGRHIPVLKCTHLKTHFVTLFDVIEHVDDPFALLDTCKLYMDHDSRLVISTPRTTDPIENPSWFYRTQHTWYFSDKSLDILCTKAGLFRCRQWITGRGDNQQLYQTYILNSHERTQQHPSTH